MCPELTNRPNAIRWAAILMFADEWTMVGFLPLARARPG
jgi:hypothetical protein